MAFGSSTISSFGGAVSDILGGKATAASLRLKAQGDRAEAGNYDLAASLADTNAAYTLRSTEIKKMQADRAAYLGIGETASGIAGSGLDLSSGSALDILRSGAEQAALTQQVLGEQGQISEAGYREQAIAYRNMAIAARSAADQEESMGGDAERNGWITGGIKAAAGIASLFI